jgi:uncharacterized protein (DUF362 family)
LKKKRLNPGCTRRDFLRQTVGLGAAYLGAGRLLTGCGGGGGGDGNGEDLGTRVAAVRGDDLEAMTRQALEALGGIGKIVKPGESVFIKPNLVTLPFGYLYDVCTMGECTKPEILVAVAEACLSVGASEVVIGDGSQMPYFEWSNLVYLDGSTHIVEEARRLQTDYPGNVRLLCVEPNTPRWVEVPTSDSMGAVSISSLVTSADRVISIPVAKTHAWAHVSLALKNFLGVTSLDRYATWIPTPGYWNRGDLLDHSSPAAVAQIYLDIVAAVKPDLSIIDFSFGVEGNGPAVGAHGGKTVDVNDRLGSWLVLASTDPVAADATAARVMGFNPAEIDQLTMAEAMGLGKIGEGEIEVLGERIDDIQVTWEPAVIANRSRTSVKPYHICPRAFEKGCTR